MHGSDPRNDLARHLERLSVRGELRESTVVLGVSSDPFHPFDEKFAASLRLLEIFERFVPGQLVIQTRSPLVVIALAALKRVRDATAVVIGIETPLEEVRRRYTPELPSIAERWKVVRTAKRFGFKVGVQVGPMLPYGDWRRDAPLFADELAEAGDFITIQSVVQGEGGGRPRSALARALAADRQFFWLRHDTHRPLEEAITQVAGVKLYHPLALPLPERQLPLFA
jgi:DNA repair photolyase